MTVTTWLLSAIIDVMNKAGMLIYIFCFLIFAPDYVCAQDGTEEAINWRMAILKGNSSAYESMPFRQPLSMTRRDVFQLYLSFDGRGFCYVILENDEGSLPFMYKKSVSPGDRITLPGDAVEGDGEGQNFNAAGLLGTSRFYVIVSAEPKPNLERLIDQHKREPVSVSLDRSLLSEVLAVRRSISPGPGSSAESGQRRTARRDSPRDRPGTTVPPTEADPAMRGELSFYEGREAWAVTATVRVQ